MKAFRLASSYAVSFSVLCVLPAMLPASTVQINSPADIPGPSTTINFDDIDAAAGFAGGIVVNTLYADQGVVFSRPGGYAIPVINWASLGRITTSPPSVIATISGVFEGQAVPFFATELSLSFTRPVFALGAFFGNDQFSDYTASTLSAFDVNHQLLGSVSVPTNRNTSVDQFIGLESTVPIFSAQFQNDGPDLSVVLDDVTFSSSPVPEPTLIGLVGSGLLGLACLRCIQLWRNRTQLRRLS